jgi:hypothetical protein
VRRVLPFGRELSHDRVVVAAVETQTLRSRLGRLGPFDRDRVERLC